MGCVRLWYHFLLGGLLCDAIIFLLWFNSNSPSRFHSSSLSFSRFFSLKHNEKNSYKNQVSAFFLSINRLGLRLLTLKWILTLFRYNKNNTGPNLDPCGTPHGEERREGGGGGGRLCSAYTSGNFASFQQIWKKVALIICSYQFFQKVYIVKC